MQIVHFEDILSLAEPILLVDVRSPGEFVRGHIPGANNIPLFSDQIRALVGTIYVQHGREQAMHVAMQDVGPRFDDLVAQVKKIFTDGRICVYCARGGMRSKSVTWLYNLFGLPVMQLNGGYKSFRNWALAQFDKKIILRVLSGPTGSGKTDYLHMLTRMGEQVLDLEKYAQHKGSVFGGDKDKQATQQQFENDCAFELAKLNIQKRVWIEDESRKIGSVIIPEKLWLQMHAARFYYLISHRNDRLERILNEYGTLDQNFLLHALAEIKDHLGLQNYQLVKSLIKKCEIRESFDILLNYYDKKYAHGQENKNWVGALVAPQLLYQKTFNKWHQVTV